VALPGAEPTNPRPPRAGLEVRCYGNPPDRLRKMHRRRTRWCYVSPHTA
jgi:hypothetical protein